MPEGEAGTLYSEVQDCSVQIHSSDSYGSHAEKQAEELHHHGHSHGPTGNMKTGIADIAWMVILGDGIHNFIDGLAIGKTFFFKELDFLFYQKEPKVKTLKFFM